MLRAHKIQLKPNNKQATYFAKACGVACFAYNWALAEWKQAYAAGEKPTEGALRRKLNSVKREQYPWMLEVTKNAPQMAIIQLGQAFQNFFAKRASYPQFHKKGTHDRFSLTNDQFAVKDFHIRVPHIGWVRMREALRFSGKILSAVISKTADRWFVSVTVETPTQSTFDPSENQAMVGVDLGISAFATLSTGEKISGPKPHKALLLRLRRLAKSLSRKQKGSKDRIKAKQKLAKLHYRIANIRKEAIHQLTSKLTQQFSLIGIEDLHVKGMMQNRRLSRSLADMGFYEFRRQLIYKAACNDIQLITVSRWFASSKLCSRCHYKLDVLPLSVREWTCPNCKITHDRDINAAINILNWAVSPTVTACGVSSGGVVTNHVTTSHGTLKQETNIKVTYGQL